MPESLTLSDPAHATAADPKSTISSQTPAPTSTSNVEKPFDSSAIVPDNAIGEKPTEAKPEAKPEVKPEVKAAETPATLITDAELQTFQADFDKNGTLSEDSLKAIEAKGLPRRMAVQFMEGQAALAAQRTQQVFDAAGGQEQYTKAATWARTALPEAERAAFDATLASGDMAAIQTAVKGLTARFVQENGSSPTLTTGRPSHSDVKPFESMQECIREMQDPKYKQDPAFRRGVEQRLAAARKAGKF